MDFDYSPRQKELIRRVSDFMDEHIYPAVPIYEEQAHEGDRWKVIPIIEELKVKARPTGLWNMFMPPHSGVPPLEDTFQFEGIQLTNLEYAPICRACWARSASPRKCSTAPRRTPATWKCSMRYGTLEQKEQLAAAADERRDPLRLPDDRAARSPPPTPPTSRPASSATAITT